MAIGIRSVVISFKEYRYHKEIIKENDKLDEAILSINRYTNRNMIDEIEIDEINNEIKVTIRNTNSKEFQKVKKIRLDNFKRVTLESYEGESKKAVNTILRDAEKFDIVKKGEINYLIIKTIKGEERILCI